MAAFPPISFSRLRLVTDKMLAARLETVKVLDEKENDVYSVEKDKETGEHYLHYAVRHLNLAAGGAEEMYHHWMPIGHDDVIALALGAPEYTYPEHWLRPYLRNGPGGGYVWYDPDGAADDHERYESIAEDIRTKLDAFRKEGRSGEEDIRRLMDEIDRLFDS